MFRNIILIVIAFLTGMYLAPYFIPHNSHFSSMQMHGMRDEFVSEKNHMIAEMIAEGDYKCCLEKPCTYCIEKSPGHGEGASCNCLTDVVEGRHPCGECIGEILEGHGNRYLAPYFAKAISEEVGESHYDALKQIISEKYEVPVADLM